MNLFKLSLIYSKSVLQLISYKTVIAYKKLIIIVYSEFLILRLCEELINITVKINHYFSHILELNTMP